MDTNRMTMMNTRLQAQQPQYVDMSSPYFLIIQTFHSLPHLNMWFEMSNSTFDPNSSDYLEVLLHNKQTKSLLLYLIIDFIDNTILGNSANSSTHIHSTLAYHLRVLSCCDHK